VQRLKASCPTSTEGAANNVVAASQPRIPLSRQAALTSQKAAPFCGRMVGAVERDLAVRRPAGSRGAGPVTGGCLGTRLPPFLPRASRGLAGARLRSIQFAKLRKRKSGSARAAHAARDHRRAPAMARAKPEGRGGRVVGLECRRHPFRPRHPPRRSRLACGPASERDCWLRLPLRPRMV